MSHSTGSDAGVRGWALFPWFEEHGPSHIHPEDFAGFKALPSGTQVFAVLGDVDGFTEIAYGREVFRVRPSLLRPVPAPKYVIGQRVRIPGKDDAAEIAQIFWHHKEAKPFFIVRLGGKPKSRRYWAEELEPST